MLHKLKLKKEFADAVIHGEKCFEVRLNDRGYQKGDIVQFTVVDGTGTSIYGSSVDFFSDMRFEITYVLSGWGIKEGYVVFGIRALHEPCSLQDA